MTRKIKSTFHVIDEQTAVIIIQDVCSKFFNRGRLLLRTPGPVPFWICICSNVETILSWTCHVYGPFEIRTSLGTSFLLAVLQTYILSDKKWTIIAIRGGEDQDLVASDEGWTMLFLFILLHVPLNLQFNEQQWWQLWPTTRKIKSSFHVIDEQTAVIIQDLYSKVFKLKYCLTKRPHIFSERWALFNILE